MTGEFAFTAANSIELPGHGWVMRDDLARPCGICGHPIFDVVLASRLVPARRLDPEHWSDPVLSIQCRWCFGPDGGRPAWERAKVREERLGTIDTRTGIYTPEPIP